MSALSHEAANHALERAVLYLDHHSFSYQGTGVVLQIAFDQTPDPVDFMVWNRCGLSFERHDVDHPGAFQDGERVLFFEPRETVAGEERPIDLLLPILPAAPAGDGGQKRVEMLALDLVADNLLVARTRPDGKPGRRHV
jgi:hypothetical protein